MITRIIIYSLSIIFILSSCKNEECVEYRQSPVTSTNSPTIGEVNKEIPIYVSFGCFNGCGQFHSFEENKQGNTITIKVNAKYEGCTCTQDLPIRQTTYKFKTSEKGIFYLKFLQDDNNYLINTIIVQ